MSNIAEIIFEKEREYISRFIDVQGISDIEIDTLFDVYAQMEPPVNIE